MAKRWYTAEEVADIVTADSDSEIRDLELTSEDDSSLADNDDPPALPDSDSDDTGTSAASSESESHVSDDNNHALNNTISTDTYYKTRDDAVKWNRHIPSQRGRPSGINIVDANLVGPTQIVPQNLGSPLEAFKLSFPDECVDIVLHYTNQRYEDYCHTNHRSSAVRRFRGYRPFSKEEVLAFMGLSFISGAHKSVKNPICDLYQSTYLPHFKAAISRDRLLLLIKFCRFDDAHTRDDRKDDRFGHIREVWDTFNSRCQELYGLGPHVTIDEMLQKFRGRCKFRQYMPSKPGRYGIKYWILADAENHYCYNAIPYLGKENDKPTVNLGAQVVKNLVEPIKGTNRNVTCDRYFTSVDLFEELFSDKLTAVGTVMPNRKHLPLQLLPQQSRAREVGSAVFAFKDNLTMVSWHPKRSKFVLLLSSLHHNSNIAESGKPEIVEFYNSTKAGVDALDQKVRHYTTYRKTHRWPLAVFYNILDIAAYNAFVLFKLRPPADVFKNSFRARFKFLCELGEQLIKPNMLVRAQYPNGLKVLSQNALKAFGVALQSQKSDKGETPQKRRCQLCPRKKDRKVKQFCVECRKNCCSEHSKQLIFCCDCVKED